MQFKFHFPLNRVSSLILNIAHTTKHDLFRVVFVEVVAVLLIYKETINSIMSIPGIEMKYLIYLDNSHIYSFISSNSLKQ